MNRWFGRWRVVAIFGYLKVLREGYGLNKWRINYWWIPGAVRPRRQTLLQNVKPRSRGSIDCRFVWLVAASSMTRALLYLSRSYHLRTFLGILAVLRGVALRSGHTTCLIHRPLTRSWDQNIRFCTANRQLCKDDAKQDVLRLVATNWDICWNETNQQADSHNPTPDRNSDNI